MAAAATWIWASNRKMGLLKAALAEWRREERGRAPKVMWKPAIRMQSESYVEIRGATTLSLSLSIIKRKRRRNNLREKSDRVNFIGDKSEKREEIGARLRSPPT